MDQYRVFGNPITQSKSPFIHHKFAKQTEQSMNYQSEFVSLDGFKSAVKNLIENNGKGANVTAPFKEQAFRLCDQLSQRAELAGAVNTLTFKNGLIYGDTTDGLGLVYDLELNKVELKNSRILLLGAGGAAKGVVQSLLFKKPKHLTIANRTLSKAQAIVAQYKSSPIDATTFEQTSGQSFDIIINATSIGLSGAALPINSKVIEKSTTCYDMVYGKELTPFLKEAKRQGVSKIIDGLGMLVGQAAESFKLWRQIQPDTKVILSELRAELNHEKI